MTRAQLIEKLLRTYHLNVPERRQLVPPSIDYSEILALLRDVLEQERSFSSGPLTLEKRDGATYRLHYLKHDPQLSDLLNDWMGPTIPSTNDYSSLESAVEAFMLQLGAMCDMDGIRICGFPGVRNQ